MIYLLTQAVLDSERALVSNTVERFVHLPKVDLTLTFQDDDLPKPHLLDPKINFFIATKHLLALAFLLFPMSHVFAVSFFTYIHFKLSNVFLPDNVRIVYLMKKVCDYNFVIIIQ